MDIVIVSEFSESFAKDDNDRFLYLAKMLAEKHETELVTSTFRHSLKSRRTEPADAWPFKITFLEEPGYPRNICLQRFRSHRTWGRNVLAYLKERKKPDVICCAVPSLTGPLKVAKYCEKQGIRFVIDIQDLWPEAFRMALDLPVVSSAAFMPFTRLADGIYQRADAVCAVSESYRARALKVNRKSTAGCAVYLGADIAAFDRYAAEHPLERKDGEILLGYAGTLGTSYDLPVVFSAMRKLDRKELRMIVVGDGPLTQAFRKQAEGLDVTFTGRLPLNTQDSDEYKALVDEYRMGFNCRNGDAEDLAEKLEKLMDDPELREEMGRNARRCAEEKFDRAKTYRKLTEVILNGSGN